MHFFSMDRGKKFIEIARISLEDTTLERTTGLEEYIFH